MQQPPPGDASSAAQITHLQARIDAGDRDAAGPLGELLALRGDLQDAIHVWAAAYGDKSPTTKQLAELLAREGELERAVRAWELADPVWHNPISLHRQYLATLTEEAQLEYQYDEPEEMTGTQTAKLAELLTRQGEEAVIAQLRTWNTKPDTSSATH